MRDQLRIGSRLSWIAAWALAIAAPVIYLLWPGEETWWIALPLLVPLVLLAEWRREQKGFSGEPAGGGDAGPWSPPADHHGGP